MTTQKIETAFKSLSVYKKTWAEPDMQEFIREKLVKALVHFLLLHKACKIVVEEDNFYNEDGSLNTDMLKVTIALEVVRG